MLSDGVENVQRINSHIGLGVSETYQSVVQEDVEPLFVKLLLLPN